MGAADCARSWRTPSRHEWGRAREKLASGWGYYLGDAAIADVLCFGPPQGQKVTFVHPDDWLGPQRSGSPPRRCARWRAGTREAYGPVTHRQFREWFTSRSFTPAAAGRSSTELDLPEPEPVGRCRACACCRSTTST